MTVLEKKKYNVIRAIMNDTDTKRLTEVERLYNPEPCIYTAEELQTSVTQRTQNFYDGKMELIPHDQMKEGKYRLVVRNQYSGSSTPLKELRSVVYKKILKA